jgi:hypothetical protein
VVGVVGIIIVKNIVVGGGRDHYRKRNIVVGVVGIIIVKEI